MQAQDEITFLNDLLKRVDLLSAQLVRIEDQLAQLAALLERHNELAKAIESGVLLPRPIN